MPKTEVTPEQRMCLLVNRIFDCCRWPLPKIEQVKLEPTEVVMQWGSQQYRVSVDERGEMPVEHADYTVSSHSKWVEAILAGRQRDADGNMLPVNR